MFQNKYLIESKLIMKLLVNIFQWKIKFDCTYTLIMMFVYIPVMFEVLNIVIENNMHWHFIHSFNNKEIICLKYTRRKIWVKTY